MPSAPTEPTAPMPTPEPTPQETEKSWSLSAPHFRDDDATIWAETSNRSEPFAWDRITADNMDDVRVSIDGKELPFASTTYEPAFAPDLFGAEWKAEAQVSAGAVVLVLTADEEQRDDPDRVGSIAVTYNGLLYTSIPTVTIAPPPAGGVRATATAAGPGLVTAVTMTNPGSGCPSDTTVSFSGGGGSGAAGTAILISGGSVIGVTITNGGSGYTSNPSVTFSGCSTPATGLGAVADGVTSVTVTNRGRGYTTAPAVTIAAPTNPIGAAATATATLVARRVNSQAENLYYARQTLYGKQLLVQLADE